MTLDVARRAVRHAAYRCPAAGPMPPVPCRRSFRVLRLLRARAFLSDQRERTK